MERASFRGQIFLSPCPGHGRTPKGYEIRKSFVTSTFDIENSIFDISRTNRFGPLGHIANPCHRLGSVLGASLHGSDTRAAGRNQ